MMPLKTSELFSKTFIYTQIHFTGTLVVIPNLGK